MVLVAGGRQCAEELGLFAMNASAWGCGALVRQLVPRLQKIGGPHGANP